jgi:O-antigen/teichoic acid export membrane protein
MPKLLQLIRQSDFLRHNGIFLIGSLLVSAFNYAYYPVLGRMLPATQFGEVQALVSLFLQATIFFTVVTNVAVHVVANELDEKRRNRIIYELEHVAFLLTLAALAMCMACVGQLQRFLRFDEPGPFFALAAALLVGAPLASRSAYLRGRTAFGRVSLANMAGSFSKILFSAGFVLLGWGTVGAMGGVVVSQLVALALAGIWAWRLGLHREPGLSFWRWPDLSLIRPQLRYSALVLVVSLAITTLFSFDVLVVKHYFAPDIAGLYAGIATVARIIFFVTASITAVLLATVKIEAGHQANQRLLWRSMVLHCGLGGAVLALFTLAPSQITRLLVGAKYVGYAHLLPRLSLALFILAFVNLLFNYDLALRRSKSAISATLSLAAMACIVIVHHNNINAVVDSLVLGSVLSLALWGLFSMRLSGWSRT